MWVLVLLVGACQISMANFIPRLLFSGSPSASMISPCSVKHRIHTKAKLKSAFTRDHPFRLPALLFPSRKIYLVPGIQTRLHLGTCRCGSSCFLSIERERGGGWNFSGIRYTAPPSLQDNQISCCMQALLFSLTHSHTHFSPLTHHQPTDLCVLCSRLVSCLSECISSYRCRSWQMDVHWLQSIWTPRDVRYIRSGIELLPGTEQLL